MRKEIVFFILFCLIAIGTILYKLDYENVKNRQEPKYCIKIVSEENQEIKYLCLGYAVYREYNKNISENIAHSKSVKMGVWFFKKQDIKYN